MFKVIKKEGSARRGEFVTVHGTVQTPAFMNVATCGAIKGAVSSQIYKVERSYPYRQRRISGVLSCKVEKY